MTTLAASTRGRGGGLRAGLALSALVHIGAVTAVWMLAQRPEAVTPPVYRVRLLGAPAGPRRAGVVSPSALPAPSSPAVAPSGAERAAPVEKSMAKLRKVPAAPAKATPTTAPSRKAGDKASKSNSKSAAPPRAASGAVGGTGADVANLDTKGIEFPYPGYLNNIVRQLTLSWTPRRTSATLTTEVKFLIRRDGSVVGIEVVRGSGDRLYDSEATGAVEAVGSTRSFGALPSGWKDDVLVVYFTFDYSLRP